MPPRHTRQRSTFEDSAWREHQKIRTNRLRGSRSAARYAPFGRARLATRCRVSGSASLRRNPPRSRALRAHLLSREEGDWMVVETLGELLLEMRHDIGFRGSRMTA